MPSCVAVGCSNSSIKGYLMKIFPRDPVRRALWATKVKRLNWAPTKTSCLCEMHFDSSQWEKTRVDGSRKLKCNAVPTIFGKQLIKSKKNPPRKPTPKAPPSDVNQGNSLASDLAKELRGTKNSEQIIEHIQNRLKFFEKSGSIISAIDLARQYILITETTDELCQTENNEPCTKRVETGENIPVQFHLSESGLKPDLRKPTTTDFLDEASETEKSEKSIKALKNGDVAVQSKSLESDSEIVCQDLISSQSFETENSKPNIKSVKSIKDILLNSESPISILEPDHQSPLSSYDASKTFKSEPKMKRVRKGDSSSKKFSSPISTSNLDHPNDLSSEECFQTENREPKTKYNENKKLPPMKSDLPISDLESNPQIPLPSVRSGKTVKAEKIIKCVTPRQRKILPKKSVSSTSTSNIDSQNYISSETTAGICQTENREPSARCIKIRSYLHMKSKSATSDLESDNQILESSEQFAEFDENVRADKKRKSGSKTMNPAKRCALTLNPDQQNLVLSQSTIKIHQKEICKPSLKLRSNPVKSCKSRAVAVDEDHKIHLSIFSSEKCQRENEPICKETKKKKNPSKNSTSLGSNQVLEHQNLTSELDTETCKEEISEIKSLKEKLKNANDKIKELQKEINILKLQLSISS